MGLSPEVIQRINRLGFVTEDDLKFWRSMWLENEPVFWVSLCKQEEAAENYRRWFPRLQEFAAGCRRRIPVPSSESFSAAEREQYRILLAKMRKFVESGDCRCVFSGEPNHVAILSTTRVGLTAAEEVFGGRGAVILLQSEREQWFRDVCPIDLEAHWWYSFAWWTIMTWEERLVRENHPIPEGWIPEGCSYWFVESGVQWGSLAGGSDEELWKWDGKRAKFIEERGITSY
jgi:hypothetical protein